MLIRHVHPPGRVSTNDPLLTKITQWN